MTTEITRLTPAERLYRKKFFGPNHRETHLRFNAKHQHNVGSPVEYTDDKHGRTLLYCCGWRHHYRYDAQPIAPPTDPIEHAKLQKYHFHERIRITKKMIAEFSGLLNEPSAGDVERVFNIFGCKIDESQVKAMVASFEKQLAESQRYLQELNESGLPIMFDSEPDDSPSLDNEHADSPGGDLLCGNI